KAFQLFLFYKRLITKPFTCGFVNSIGNSSSCRWKCGLTKSSWIYTVIYEMGFDFGHLLHADQAIAVKVFLLGKTIFEGHIAKHSMTHTVYHTPSHLLICTGRIDNYTTVRRRIYLFQYRVTLFHPHFGHLRHVGAVGKIHAKTLM